MYFEKDTLSGEMERGTNDLGKGGILYGRVSTTVGRKCWARGSHKCIYIVGQARGRISALTANFTTVLGFYYDLCNLANALFKITQDVFRMHAAASLFSATTSH